MIHLIQLIRTKLCALTSLVSRYSQLSQARSSPSLTVTSITHPAVQRSRAYPAGLVSAMARSTGIISLRKTLKFPSFHRLLASSCLSLGTATGCPNCPGAWGSLGASVTSMARTRCVPMAAASCPPSSGAIPGPAAAALGVPWPGVRGAAVLLVVRVAEVPLLPGTWCDSWLLVKFPPESKPRLGAAELLRLTPSLLIRMKRSGGDTAFSSPLLSPRTAARAVGAAPPGCGLPWVPCTGPSVLFRFAGDGALRDGALPPALPGAPGSPSPRAVRSATASPVRAGAALTAGATLCGTDTRATVPPGRAPPLGAVDAGGLRSPPGPRSPAAVVGALSPSAPPRGPAAAASPAAVALGGPWSRRLPPSGSGGALQGRPRSRRPRPAAARAALSPKESRSAAMSKSSQMTEATKTNASARPLPRNSFRSPFILPASPPGGSGPPCLGVGGAVPFPARLSATRGEPQPRPRPPAVPCLRGSPPRRPPAPGPVASRSARPSAVRSPRGKGGRGRRDNVPLLPTPPSLAL